MRNKMGRENGCCWVYWGQGRQIYLAFNFAIIFSSTYFRFRQVQTDY